MNEIYLDNSATTKIDDKVLKSMMPYLTEKYGNASSFHLKGAEVSRDIEYSREVIAKAIGASRNEIIFTSSGTESNNFALKGLFFKNYPEKNHIIISKIEHDCILNTCKWLETLGAKITYLDVDSEGFINFKDVENSITDKTILVSIIHGNNEVGTIQDIKSIGEICKKKNVLFHTDACQSFTKVDINVKKQNLDLVTLNAHKIHGPKGVGVLYIKEGIKITPLMHGGGQEKKLRSGTYNVPGIVGFAKAVKIANKKDVKKMIKLREKLIEGILKIPTSKLNGSQGDKRLCNNVNISFKNIEGEAIGEFLNVKKIFVSTGSACSSKSLEPSHVLMSLGMSVLEANSSIRISLSKYTTEKEIEYFLIEIKKTVERLRTISPLAN